jgi:methyltransferase
VTLPAAILLLVTLERIAELRLARRNTSRLKARGATEYAAGHYPFIVALHAAWLAGLWLLALERPVNLYWLALFGVLQAMRVWVLATLGPRWTTRVIVLQGAPLIRAGPYRWFSHPNYLVVIGEIAVLPLVFGLGLYALVFSLLNCVLLAIRISAENHALGAGADLGRSRGAN